MDWSALTNKSLSALSSWLTALMKFLINRILMQNTELQIINRRLQSIEEMLQAALNGNKKMPEVARWCNQSDAARMLGVSLRTIMKLAGDPQTGIVTKKIGLSKNSKVLYHIPSLETYLKK
jgi:hypothetical protein